MIDPTIQNDDTEKDLIVELTGQNPNGLGQGPLLDQLNERLTQPISRRTLSRRLNALRDAGHIRVHGAGKATRYQLARAKAVVQDAADTNYPPLTNEGARARDLVRQPLADRPPIGYNAEFLLDYRPGRDWYLTDAIRVHLHAVGRTSDAARPAGTFARNIIQRLLIDLSWASSRLEGNTYSVLETQRLLEEGVRADGKNAEESQMILNHKKAIEMLVDQAEDIGFNRYTLLNLHAALSDNLLDDSRDEGRVRTRPTGISGTSYVPLAIPQRLNELLDELLDRASRISDPFEQAFFAMVHFPYLQPFADVNKRTSRLAANISLIKANYCPLSFIDVPERAYVEGTLAVYEFNDVALLRDVFVWAYERSCQQYRVVRDSVQQPDPVRLRYRNELSQVIAGVVTAGTQPDIPALAQWASRVGVNEQEQERFAAIAFELLANLHEGATYRYGLRPSEFQRWIEIGAAGDMKA